MRAPAAALALVLAAQGALSRNALELEVGVVVDAYSESYGAGDLFQDLDAPGTTRGDEVPEPLTRITRDETLVGASARVSWSPRGDRERKLVLDYEHNDASATGEMDARWRFGTDDTWSVRLDEHLRVQLGLRAGDESRDTFHALDLTLSRPIPSLGRVSITGEQTFSRVDGDSLSRLFDYTVHGLGARLEHAFGPFDGRWRADLAYREAASDFSSNDVRVRGGAALRRHAFTGFGLDLEALLTRRAYDESGLVSPSGTEVELDGGLSRPVGGGVEVSVESELIEARFDEPDETYFDYARSRALGGARWSSIGGLSFSLAAGGEWLRSRGDTGGAYDQSRARVGAGYLGLGGFWFDVEESFGVRDYLGTSSRGGILTDEGVLDSASSDFRYSELAVLLGYERGVLDVDAFLQYTIESHDVEADDVSFVLVNVRVTSRF